MGLQLTIIKNAAHFLLDDQATRNALTDDLVAELTTRLAEIAATPEIDAVVIRGAGVNFCSGGSFAELEEMRSMARRPPGGEAVRAKVRKNARLIEQLRKQPQRTIAVLSGAVVGAGVGIAAACDDRVSSEQLRVLGGFDRVGLVSDLGTAVSLSRVVGQGSAEALLINGAQWDAATALQHGFVSRVIPDHELESWVLGFVERIPAGDGARVAAQRQTFQSAVALSEALDREAVCFAELLSLVMRKKNVVL